jgi:alpha/beta superfamily hydrolase
VPVVHFPLTNPSRSTLIVYSHGNGSDLNNVYHLARRLYELYGVAVVAYDYTGYGESRQERGSFEEDIRTVLAWVVSKGYRPGRIVLAGFSLDVASRLNNNVIKRSFIFKKDQPTIPVDQSPRSRTVSDRCMQVFLIVKSHYSSNPYLSSDTGYIWGGIQSNI